MSYVINLGLDPDLPLMVFADLSLLYPLSYVFGRDGRRLAVTEDRVHRLVQRAILDVRCALKVLGVKAKDYLQFRALVVETLCLEYGFVLLPGTIHNILSDEIEGLIEHPIPGLNT